VIFSQKHLQNHLHLLSYLTKAFFNFDSANILKFNEKIIGNQGSNPYPSAKYIE